MYFVFAYFSFFYIFIQILLDTVGIWLRDVCWSNKPMIELEQRISVDQILISIYYVVIQTRNQNSVDE